MPARQRWLTSITRVLRRLAAPTRLAGIPGPSAGASAQPTADVSSDPVVSYLADLLASTRDELNRVDSKASLLLAAVGATIGALLACFTGSNWTPMSLAIGEQVLWWAGMAVATVGVFLISASVYPRFRQRRTPHPDLPAYYGDVAAFPDIGTFRRAIGKPPDAAERLSDQVYVVARITQAKYVQLQRGLLCLLIAIVACALSIVLHALLS